MHVDKNRKVSAEIRITTVLRRDSFLLEVLLNVSVMYFFLLKSSKLANNFKMFVALSPP